MKFVTGSRLCHFFHMAGRLSFADDFIESIAAGSGHGSQHGTFGQRAVNKAHGLIAAFLHGKLCGHDGRTHIHEHDSTVCAADIFNRDFDPLEARAEQSFLQTAGCLNVYAARHHLCQFFDTFCQFLAV